MTSALHIRGDVLWLQGDIKGAQRSWADSVALAERTLGSQHPALAFLLRKLALAAQATGELAEGRTLRERGLSIADPSLAPCHPERPNFLTDLAISLAYDGEYFEAQKKYELAVSIYKRCLGERHSLMATAIINQADLASRLGNFGEAERLYQTAIDIWSAALGTDHPYVARAIDGLAEVVAKRSQFARARALYESALEIRRKAVGPNHPDVAWTLTSLARTLVASGDIQQAFEHVETAVAIYRKAGASDQPDDLARVLELRSTLEAQLGRAPQAMATLHEVLAIRARTFGRSHPLVAGSLVQLGRIEFALRQNDRALANALAAEQIGRDHFRFTIRYLPERQAMAYAAARPYGLDLALSILANGRPLEPSRVFDAVIRSRGLVLDEMAARAQMVADSSPSATLVGNQLHAARRRFASLVLRSLQADENVSPALMEEARAQKERAERDAAEQRGTGRAELNDITVGLSEVQRALPPDAALVSFVRYFSTPASLQMTAFRDQSRPAYLAFVTRAGDPGISVVSIGSAEAIERLVTDWRLLVTQLSPEVAARKAGEQLRQRIWDPLAKELKGASRVFIVPDGAVNLVNFAALPGGQDRYLLDDPLLFHYLSTERDLMISAPDPTSRSLLAVGGPAFDGPVRETSVMRGAACKALKFQPLTGTAAEVQEIGWLWSSLRRTPAVVLVGTAASETAIREGAAGREVVHFATHGFFLSSGCNLAPAGTRAVGGVATSGSTVGTVVSENPLSLAGLALAGANRQTAHDEDGEDGILTGEEVVGLNLRGTRWAVLSACDTGIGEVKAGEGVFGLRRAFQIAGARTVIMSLWSVEDQATREWMQSLYQARLRDSRDTPEAMRAASLSVLQKRRANGSTTHPFFWAAFVAAGDWR